MKSTA